MSEQIESWQKTHEALFELATHYSSIIYRSRILLISFIVSTWALIFGLKDITNDTFKHFYRALPTIGSIAIGFFVMMKAAYIDRFQYVLDTGNKLEGDHHQDLYFKSMPGLILMPFNIFYVLNILILLLIDLFYIKKGNIDIFIALYILPIACIYGAYRYLRKREKKKNG